MVAAAHEEHQTTRGDAVHHVREPPIIPLSSYDPRGAPCLREVDTVPAEVICALRASSSPLERVGERKEPSQAPNLDPCIWRESEEHRAPRTVPQSTQSRRRTPDRRGEDAATAATYPRPRGHNATQISVREKASADEGNQWPNRYARYMFYGPIPKTINEIQTFLDVITGKKKQVHVIFFC